MLILTMRSTIAFFALFLVVDIAVLLMSIGYVLQDSMGQPNKKLRKAGGFFAILTAFLAWYNGFAGIADNSNTFFVVPVVHFPWSEKGRQTRLERKESLAAEV